MGSEMDDSLSVRCGMRSPDSMSLSVSSERRLAIMSCEMMRSSAHPGMASKLFSTNSWTRSTRRLRSWRSASAGFLCADLHTDATQMNSAGRWRTRRDTLPPTRTTKKNVYSGNTMRNTNGAIHQAFSAKNSWAGGLPSTSLKGQNTNMSTRPSTVYRIMSVATSVAPTITFCEAATSRAATLTLEPARALAISRRTTQLTRSGMGRLRMRPGSASGSTKSTMKKVLKISSHAMASVLNVPSGGRSRTCLSVRPCTQQYLR
mmetsp:Transcript_11361/g.32275  ORF Transcript_11361/g.32275 Transcript_11361/m.32275 type:complete len:261 (-) Transcript_11361:359-1141(-)